MAKSTKPITYYYRVEDNTVGITRRHIGTAYARNGNVGNPTEYFLWDWEVANDDLGTFTHSGRGHATRADAYEHARARILGIPYNDPYVGGRTPYANQPQRRSVNVRNWLTVQEEMKANRT